MKLSFYFCFLFLYPQFSNAVTNVNYVQKPKDFKKFVATKTNIMVLFTANQKKDDVQNILKLFKQLEGTFGVVDCSNAELKKSVCKKAKATFTENVNYVLKHYKDGAFNKDYDRSLTKNSLQSFLRDPTGDLPFEEDPAGKDVIHILEASHLEKLFKKENKFMLMIYTNWCGYCKKIKPEYSLTATEAKGKHVFAAVDLEKPENSPIRKKYNITGFPTLLYFENSKVKYTFEGDNTKDSMIKFMDNPSAPPAEKPKDEEWSADPNSEIAHLTSKTFDAMLKEEKSVLVIFYANWCGHCKRIKPKFEEAAQKLKDKNIPGLLAAVDAMTEKDLASRYNVKGFPTLKYFENSEFKFDVKVRETDALVEFMENPSEPPVVVEEKESSWEDEETHVVFLDEETFKPFLKKKKHTMVLFYAPWCFHCKNAKPEYTRAAEEYKDDPRIEFAAVDCTKHSGICSAYEVRGYPNFKYFSYLKTQRDYTGERKADDFIKFMRDPDAVPAKKPVAEDLEPFTSDHIIKLTDTDFDKTIAKEKSILVMFYTSWCGYCKRLKSPYSIAADMIEAQNIDGKLGAVDCERYSAVCKKHDISGYPTLKYFKNGKFSSDYTEDRSTDAIVQFMKDPDAVPEKKPIAEDLEPFTSDYIKKLTDTDFDTTIAKEKSILVMFYTSWCGHCKRLKSPYSVAADTIQSQNIDGKLGAVDCERFSAICKKQGISGYPTLKYFKSGKFASDYDQDRSTEAIVKFMKDPDAVPEKKPIAEDLEPFTSDYIKKLTDIDFDKTIAQEKSILVMFYTSWCGHCKRLKSPYSVAADMIQSQNIDGTLGAVDCERYSAVCQKQGINGYPTLKYFKSGKFASNYDQDRSTDAIVKFMRNPDAAPEKQPIAEDLEPFTSDYIKKLTDTDFDTTIAKEKSILVMFYTSWCGHCKRLKSPYSIAADMIEAQNIDGKLGAVDCERYSALCKKQDISGYPTLKYFKSGKFASDYDQDRSTEAIVKFMKDPEAVPEKKPIAEDLEPFTSDYIKKLTDTDFDTTIAKEKSILVMFYTSWCGHCKRLKSPYSVAADMIQSQNIEGKLGAVDCERYSALCKKQDISGYPTLKYFKSGKFASDYDQDRSTEAIVKFMKDPEAVPEKKPIAEDLEPFTSDYIKKLTDTDFDTTIAKEKSILVMFYTSWCGHCKRLKSPYSVAADMIQSQNIEGKLGAVDCERYSALCKKQDISGYPTLKYFKSGKFASDYDQDRSTDAIVKFMRNPDAVPEKKPIAEDLEPFTSDYIKKLTDTDFDTTIAQEKSILVMFYTSWCGHCKRLKSPYSVAADMIQSQNIEGKLGAVDCERYSAICKKQDISGYPTLKYFKSGKFASDYDQDRSTDAIVRFIKTQTVKEEL